MNSKALKYSRVQQLLTAAAQSRILVVGDVMLDQFIWGTVARISPEAPVPIVEFEIGRASCRERVSYSV